MVFNGFGNDCPYLRHTTVRFKEIDFMAFLGEFPDLSPTYTG